MAAPVSGEASLIFLTSTGTALIGVEGAASELGNLAEKGCHALFEKNRERSLLQCR